MDAIIHAGADRQIEGSSMNERLNEWAATALEEPTTILLILFCDKDGN